MAGRLAMGLLVMLAVISVGAPLWTAWLSIGPEAIVGPPHMPVSNAHWLGTDAVGRDVLARVLYGARTSFGVAVVAAFGAAVIGGGLGAVAGFVGGWTDELLVRATEATMAIPKLPLLLLLGAVDVPGGLFGRVVFLVGLLVIMAWPGPARLTRASAMQCRTAGFVVAAEALGATQVWILWWHIVPKVVPVAAVSAAGDVATLILLESLLSYLGFGIPEPAPSLGNLLGGGLPSLFEAPLTLVVPGFLTVCAVTSLHLLADGWAATLDPFRSSPEPQPPASVRLRDG